MRVNFLFSNKSTKFVNNEKANENIFLISFSSLEIIN